jgi:hypothetical protein
MGLSFGGLTAAHFARAGSGGAERFIAIFMPMPVLLPLSFNALIMLYYFYLSDQI